MEIKIKRREGMKREIEKRERRQRERSSIEQKSKLSKQRPEGSKLATDCEYRIKKLRNEDSIMRKIRNRRKAQDRWDKLRKYVMYTWGCNTLDDSYNNIREGTCCSSFMVESLHKNGSSVKHRQHNKMDTISFNRKINFPCEKISEFSIPQKATPGQIQTQAAQSCVAKSTSNLEGRLSCSRSEPVLESKMFGAVRNGKHEHHIGSHDGDVPKSQAFPTTDNYSLPPPPSLEFKSGSEISMSDIKKNFQSLYEYNVMLRERKSEKVCVAMQLVLFMDQSEVFPGLGILDLCRYWNSKLAFSEESLKSSVL
ncbi:hypothetical protein TEA_008922 [Camellia sinensis var. sinensis]|uniref:Uncharacterized protein n=1 Tax=Camellia sinensis var. sinensis TaxID=542762 RepID=A0A4S4DSD1_CAMSN|nr:hypothetical protein TEA_008922 [Camellia sinensis var. sinensis]